MTLAVLSAEGDLESTPGWWSCSVDAYMQSTVHIALPTTLSRSGQFAAGQHHGSHPLGFWCTTRASADRPVVEDDIRYRRIDLSEVNAFKARRSFAQQVSRGEHGIQLAKVNCSQQSDTVELPNTVLQQKRKQSSQACQPDHHCCRRQLC